MPGPTVFDDAPTPGATVFDDATYDPHPYETWINNLIPRVAKGVARGAGIPTSMEELQQAGASSPWDVLKNIAGPVPPAVVGMGANVADAAKRVIGGDVVGGGAQAATVLSPLLGFGEEMAGQDNGGLTKLPTTPEVNPSVKKLTETLPVPAKQVPRFQQAAQTAIPALKEFESPQTPITLQNWHAAQELAEAKRSNAAESFIAPARARGVQVDGNIIADEMTGAIPAAWKTDPKYAQVYQASLDQANSYRNKPMSVDDNINGIRYNNARLTPFYRASEDQQYAMQAGGFPLAELEAEARGRRNALAQAVDPEHNGAQFQQIRQEQSDLINFRQHGEQLENQLQKQYTPTGMQQKGQQLSDLSSIWHGDYRQALTSKMKSAPQLGDMFSDAFAKYDGPQLPETPTAGPGKYQAIPPSHQLPPATIRLGSPQTSAAPPRVNVTGGNPARFYDQDPFGLRGGRVEHPQPPNDFQTNPLEGSSQNQNYSSGQFGGKSPTYQEIHLDPTDPGRFIRQRNWNEVLADPKTLANESTEVGHHRMDLQQQGPRQDFLRQLGLDEQ